MSASKEAKLTKWIGRSPLINRSPESPLVMKELILNFNLAHKRKTFREEYTKNFPSEEPPISAEFDLIYILNFFHSCKNKKITIDYVNPAAIEIKYFRKEKKGINWPYYAGLDQILAYLKFGFYRTELWHFFDYSIPKKTAFKYISNLRDLLNKTQHPRPIYYAYYLCEDGEEKKEFDKKKLVYEYESSPNVDNPYKNDKRSDFINKFILQEIEKKYGELFKSTVDPKYPYTQHG